MWTTKYARLIIIKKKNSGMRNKLYNQERDNGSK